jgi:UDP-glucose 4-epimerase
MATFLVTGGAGFIGSHVVEHLIGQGASVRVLDDFSTGRRDNLGHLPGRFDLVEASITDSNAVRGAVRGADYIIHLAALPSVQRSVEDPLASHHVCATGTVQILNAARLSGVRRVVYAASSSAYGDIEGTIRNEDEPVSPMSPYAAAKLAGEYYCRSFGKVYGLQTVRLRFFNIFGPRQDASSPYSGVIAIFTSAMLEGRRPLIYGDGLQSRDFTYIDNAVQAVMKAVDSPKAVGNVYNIGNGAPSTSVLDLVRELNGLLGSSIEPEFAPARAGDVRHSQADIGRAQRDLGYLPQVSFVEGLRRTLEAQRRLPRRGA